ncbi:MAG: hypothetical protein ACRDWG_11535 [Actinomycetes bacterium]
MLLQEFVRGMRGLSPTEVDAILADGMLCQALLNPPVLSPWEAEEQLSDVNLDRHRHDHAAYGASSPYISTSAGTYREGDLTTKFNQPMFALETALQFAVLLHRTDGWVFYGYHFILGRPAGRHAEFAEEVRDLHQHPQWSQFRGEGEIAAAVRIPSRRLRQAELYTYAHVTQAIRSGGPLVPAAVAKMPTTSRRRPY